MDKILRQLQAELDAKMKVLSGYRDSIDRDTRRMKDTEQEISDWSKAIEVLKHG